MDIVLGIILLIIIPGGVYFLLGLAGMPVSGKKGETFEESLERAERQKAIETEDLVPLTAREFKLQFDKANSVLDDSVPRFLQNARAESNNQYKSGWIKAASSAASKSKAIFESLLKEIERSDKLSKRPQEYRIRVNGAIARADRVLAECRRLDPFGAVRPR